MSNWHILRGVILYIVTRPHGLELMLSTGVCLRIRASEAKKMNCSLEQLATLISLGADLPAIQFQALVSKDMLPIWDKDASHSSFFKPKDDDQGGGSPKPPSPDSPFLPGRSGYHQPPSSGSGGRSK